MSNKYLKKTQDIIKSIVESVAKKGSSTIPVADLQEFITQYYALVSYEDLEDFSHDQLCAMAESTLSFCQKRSRGIPKVRVFNPTLSVDGWNDAEHTVVEVLNDDMPFLVDSVTEELSRCGARISLIIHPVINISRDGDGKNMSLHPSDSEVDGTKIAKESLLSFHISRLQDEESRRKLEEDIEKVLDAIYLAVVDWKSILGKVDDTITELSTLKNKEHTSDVCEFLEWLRSDNFVLLGYIEYDFLDTKSDNGLSIVDGSELGIFRSTCPDIRPQGLKALTRESLHFAQHPSLIEITKSNRKSVVHRPVHMDYIGIKHFDSEGKVVGERRFIGLFTSIVYYQRAQQIPIIRQKIDYVLEQAGFSPSGHSGKALLAALEAFPRDELFQTPEDELLETAIGIVTLATRPRVRLFVRKDKFERFISCIIFLPKESLSTQLREEMQDILCNAFNGGVATHYTQITDSHLARLHVIIKTEPGCIPEYDIHEIEQLLAKAASSWMDELRDMLVERKGEMEGEQLLHNYTNAFTAGYSNRFNAEMAYRDIEEVEEVIAANHIAFDLFKLSTDENHILQLKIYSPDEQLHLSDIMPMLENMGIKAVDGQTLRATPRSTHRTIWLHHFRFTVNGNLDRSQVDEVKEGFETALEKLWSGDIQDDGFNKLILSAGLKWREVVLIRAYSKYLRQIGFTYSQDYIEDALAKHPILVNALVELFKIRFDPEYTGSRDAGAIALRSNINHLLSKVENIAEDKVIRRFVELNLATLRTNYYQHDSNGQLKSYISFKFDSSAVPELPLPHPYAEIFVYSPRVEGIHLRGGKVARGGLRWSDRFEDFRTEVLGLMKAQMTKNAVIVPVGSKGGFVVKFPPKEGGREAFMQEGIACYKTFLRGLLDITDNIVEDVIVPPSKVIRYDDDDPYLVVAADKGTATFSDIANGISADYNFWLGDAFASGGSVGYDHKKMGITARGAWVSVQRHFREMGIDTQSEDFTAIGIGDMAGDVFGNGMLLSEHIRLVGAFNHMHIFLDPNPESAPSYKERKRLFETPGTTWTDYDSKLISKGGNIFERSAKSIKLTPEIKQLLDVDDDELSPDSLIQAMLLASVDLLWNGGIGTYVKAASESHDMVGDRANDVLRVDGKDLRCKVVGEGGNLGFTQNGRIEYAMQGGRINTDAIDNSAGVDCSDHEVNIKIALGKALENKKLTLDARDALLEEMTESVSALVLRDNQLQTQAITIAEQQKYGGLEMMQRLMQTLEHDGFLDRDIEFLPDDEAIARRSLQKIGLTRPEISVLQAYSKMSVYNNLLSSNLPDDAYYINDLVRYFPEHLHETFRKELEEHQLRREIIATYITNSLVNRVGCTFFHHVREDTGLQGCDIARAYTITRDIYNLRSIWNEIEALDGVLSVETQSLLFSEVQELVERSSLWFLRNHPHPLKVSDSVNNFSAGISELSECLESVLSLYAKQELQASQQRFIDLDVPESLAQKIAGLEAMASACDIVQVARGGNLPVSVAGKVYFQIGSRLNIGWLRSQVYKLNTESYWQRLSHKTLVDDLFDEQRRLTAAAIKFFCTDDVCELALDNWVKANTKQIARYDQFIEDLKGNETITSPMLLVTVKRIEAICSV